MPATPTAPLPARRLGRWASWLIAAGLPWLWFVVRDDLRWAGDTIALSLPMVFYALVCLVVAAVRLTRNVYVLLTGFSLVLVVLATIVVPGLPRPMPAPLGGVRLVELNVREGNRQVGQAVQDVMAQHPDVVVVSETRDRTIAAFAGLFSYQAVLEPYLSSYTELVLSKYPLREAAPITTVHDRALRVVVDAPQPFVLYAVHLQRPLVSFPTLDGAKQFDDHLHKVQALRQAAQAETMPVVITGDFNMSDRERGYRSMTADLRDAMRAGWARATFHGKSMRPLDLRIDHVFESRSWCAADTDRFYATGSDHWGIAVRIGPCGAA